MQQVSFSCGEVTPLLHARVDLTWYATSLAKLLNFIVLPQGGVARRPGFEFMTYAAKTTGATCPVRLISFVYNSDDAMAIELTDRRARFFTATAATGSGPVGSTASPYAEKDLADLKYVQSGNVIFFAHRDYPIYMLTRESLSSWKFEIFPFEDGPWLPEDTAGDDVVKLKVTGTGYIAGDPKTYYKIVATHPVFTPDMNGTLVSMDFQMEGASVSGKTTKMNEWYTSASIEVGAEYYLETHGDWNGQVQLQKSVDGGKTWITIRDYSRRNTDTEGQLQYSGAETGKNILYRVRALQTNARQVEFNLTASGYVKKIIFRLTHYVSDTEYWGTLITENAEGEAKFPTELLNKETITWNEGAWNVRNGWPAAVCFYQNRFVAAGTKAQPQTIWMSKIDDYKSFGVSDPIRDDDAINITLNAEDADGIHSMVAMNDILVFTASSEWKISGAGDSGAITPSAVVAHRQSKIGSRNIQPLVANDRVVMIQTHGTEVHLLGYRLDVDGYAGSDISKRSQHLFEWKTAEGSPSAGRDIVKLAYQQVPDSLLWFILRDGTAVSCTLLPEQEVIGWARHETNGKFGDFCCVPGANGSLLWAAVQRGGLWQIERMSSRADELCFRDAGSTYESGLETLRINYDIGRGASFPTKKLIARLSAYVVRGKHARVSQATDRERVKDRAIEWEYSSRMEESDIQVDGGFEKGAAIQMWVDDESPLTVLSLSPSVTPGGG